MSFQTYMHVYVYLNEGDKVCECYSCLKLTIQAHLHDAFSQYFCMKCFTTPTSKNMIESLCISHIYNRTI